MTTGFESNFAYWKEEPDGITVGFADDQYETKHYLLLERGCDDEGESQNQVRIELNDQRWASSGGIERVEFDSTGISLSLDPRAAQRLRADRDVRIFFSPHVKIDGLEKTLRALFEGTSTVFRNR